MGQHHKAKLGPAGRAQLVSVIKTGATFRAAAAAMNVAPATAHRWWWRWQHATERERVSGRWAWDRSSRPRTLSGAHLGRAGAADLSSARADQSRSGTVGRDGGLSALDGARRSQAPRDFAPTPGRAPDVQAL